jgi:hypothetical protein
MERIEDGGPVFPAEIHGSTHEGEYTGKRDVYLNLSGGMSLRDWFAGQALIALMSNKAWVTGLDAHCERFCLEFRPELARSAYETADAMLKARAR